MVRKITPEQEELIVKLTRDGLSARKVRDMLKLDVRSETVGNVARRRVGRVKPGRNSYDNQIHPDMRPYIHICLGLRGLDRYTCGICNEPVTEGCEIHHTKYEGATVYDLQYVCRSCNLARVNKGLD